MSTVISVIDAVFAKARLRFLFLGKSCNDRLLSPKFWTPCMLLSRWEKFRIALGVCDWVAIIFFGKGASVAFMGNERYNRKK